MDTTRVCAQAGCGGYARDGGKWCPKHKWDNDEIRKAKESDRERANGPGRALYRLQAWKGPYGLRLWTLRRDPICTCDLKNCHGDGPCRRPSAHADHKIDHMGNAALFFDRENVHGLCEFCHNRKTGLEHGFSVQENTK
jgi:hypothetical protein